MNKWTALGIVLILAGVIACDKDDEEGEGPRNWSAQALWNFGSRPVTSRDGDRILFLREGAEGGLYLLENGSARKLNVDGPAVRADYAWSHDGARICFSGPGLPGEGNAGIYVSTNSELNQFDRIWDRGSDPCFSRDDTEIICAGPEFDETEGIWKIDLSTHERVRIIPSGVLPKLSRDGHRVAYLFSTGGPFGRSLVVFDRQSLEYDTIGTGAVDFTWFDDSAVIVYECVQDSNGGPGPSTIYRTGPDSVLPGTLILRDAVGPCAIPGTASFVFTGFSGDLASGIFASNLDGLAEQVCDSGSTPCAVNEDRILAATPSGIFELVR